LHVKRLARRLLAALEPVTDEELFAADRWPWRGGEALVETVLWDSLRHYDAHREHLERLSRCAVGLIPRLIGSAISL
jgi:hypothetical protein